MKKVIVELKDFSKSFGKKQIIKKLDLQIYEGEFITILGASGCGKTTILRAISGLDSPTTGRVYIDGQDVTDLDPTKREVNTLFQSYALFPLMTVKKNIEFGLKMKKVPKDERSKRINDMLELVRLQGYEERKPKELSGGEQQRVSIARGLVNKPKVLLLDEPLSALDLKLRKQMQIELKTLQKKLGITFIYVTHDQDEALAMSDRIVLLHNGEIEQLDTPINIYEHPKTAYVADFIGESNIFDGSVISVDDSFAFIKLKIGNEIKALNDNLNVDDKVKFIIRPENFKVILDSKEQNKFEVKIREYIYDGFYTKILVNMEKMKDIKVTSVSNEVNVPKGDIVYLEWNIEEAIVIKDEEEA